MFFRVIPRMYYIYIPIFCMVYARYEGVNVFCCILILQLDFFTFSKQVLRCNVIGCIRSKTWTCSHLRDAWRHIRLNLHDVIAVKVVHLFTACPGSPSDLVTGTVVDSGQHSIVVTCSFTRYIKKYSGRSMTSTTKRCLLVLCQSGTSTLSRNFHFFLTNLVSDKVLCLICTFK